MRLDFKITKNTFPTAPAAMRRAIGAGFDASKGPLLASMQQMTPVDTGELRGSESATSDDTSLTLKATAGHAVFVHQGTRRMGPRPFMRGAIESGLPGVIDNITAAAMRELG